MDSEPQGKKTPLQRAYEQAWGLLKDGAVLVVVLEGNLLTALHRDGRLVAGQADVLELLGEVGPPRDAPNILLLLEATRRERDTSGAIIAIDPPGGRGD